MLSSALHSLDGFEVRSPRAVSREQWNMLNGWWSPVLASGKYSAHG